MPSSRTQRLPTGSFRCKCGCGFVQSTSTQYLHMKGLGSSNIRAAYADAHRNDAKPGLKEDFSSGTSPFAASAISILIAYLLDTDSDVEMHPEPSTDLNPPPSPPNIYTQALQSPLSAIEPAFYDLANGKDPTHMDEGDESDSEMAYVEEDELGVEMEKPWQRGLSAEDVLGTGFDKEVVDAGMSKSLHYVVCLPADQFDLQQRKT